MAEEALDIGKLNELYLKAESCDKELFSEMRSNVLMVSGKHYSNTERQLWNRVKDSSANQQTKIRVVKNRIFRNTRIYLNEILSQAPGVKPYAHSEDELQDQKAAEIANSVWQDAKHRYRLNEKIRDLAEDFIDLGECAVKIFWDVNKGKVVSYHQKVTELGQPVFLDQTEQETLDPVSLQVDLQTQQPIPHKPAPDKTKPVFSGAFVFEVIFPCNLLRAPGIESMDESAYLITRKMMEIPDVKILVGDDEEKLKLLKTSSETSFKVFNPQSGSYQDSKDQILVKEAFWRPCAKYPEGQYCMFVDAGILIEPTPLPFGIFPIRWAGFQKIQTTPRAHSIIRVMRPYQAEINRMASSAAQNSMAHGDDKLLIQAGSKLEKGGEHPGLRVLKYQGAPPTVLAGRSGDQFTAALMSTIQEMDDAVFLDSVKEDIPGQNDPSSLILRSLRQKKKFSLYAGIFQQFLIDVCELYLQLAQQYLSEDELIRIIGKRGHVDIPEFKNLDDQSYAIKLEEVGDDADTAMGRQMSITSLIQYLGKDMTPEERAQAIEAMPLLNKGKMLTEFTMNIRNADSDILALDRGEMIPARKGEKHEYIIKRLQNRMKMRDFDLLSPEIKANYEAKLAEHEQVMAEEAQKIKQMQSEFIPSGGPLVGCDIYTEVPNASGGMKQVRVRVRQEALSWLLKQMESQGQAQETMEQLEPTNQANIANEFTNTNNPQGQMSEAMTQEGVNQPSVQSNGPGAISGNFRQ